MLFILLLSSLEGHSLAARLELDGVDALNASFTGEESSDVVVAGRHLGAGVPDASARDLQCVAVLCWLETFQAKAGEASKAFVETDRAIGMTNAAAVEFGAHGLSAAADVGLVGSIFGGILNAIKVRAEGCKGNAFSCVGKASLAIVVLTVLSVCVFVVGHVFAVAASVTAGASLSFGALGAFFAHVFKHLCQDSLDQNTARALVRDASTSLAAENAEAKGEGRMPDRDLDRAAALLVQVQAARKNANSDRAVSAKINEGGGVSRFFQKLLGLHTVEAVQNFCATLQVAANPRDPRPALREELDGGEFVVRGPRTAYKPAFGAGQRDPGFRGSFNGGW